MIRNWTLAALAVCLLVPAASSAQEAPRRPSTRTRPRVRVETRNGPFGVYTFSDSRGRIGVIVDTKADAAGDKLGARVEGITPGGPAEKAGLKVGDVITRFNGTALGGAQSEDNENSGPGMKLIELAHAVDPGDTVQVEYRRGTDARKVTIVAEDLGGSTWGGIELVELNSDLGDYFGTREGVLVVRAPEDSTLALKGGDVIVSIGTRKPSSPEQAMRILRSYDTGETVTMDVLRKQKHVTVTWKVPNNEDRIYRNFAPRMHEDPSRYRVMPRIRREVQVPMWRVRSVVRTSRAI